MTLLNLYIDFKRHVKVCIVSKDVNLNNSRVDSFQKHLLFDGAKLRRLIYAQKEKLDLNASYDVKAF